MTSVPAWEKDESSSTTSGLFVVRVTSLRQACSALLGIAEDEPLSLEGRSGLPPQPASAAVARAIVDNLKMRFDIEVSWFQSFSNVGAAY